MDGRDVKLRAMIKLLFKRARLIASVGAALTPTLLAVAAGPAVAQSYRAGPLTIEAPWSRATPGGATVASGYMRITNHGSEPDRLVGGTAAVAGRVDVHESSNTEGIARMAHMEGLLIKPGETVELKPGGLHVMMTELKRPLKEGDVVSGTLVFEKAGTVALEYRVGGIGAQSAAADHQHQHQH